jgi:hypothetical protein
MKKSHIAVLSAFAVLVLIIVAMVVAARIVVTQLGSGQYDEPVATNARIGDLTSGDLDLSGFERIDARGTWEVTVVQGAEWDVALRYPEEIEQQLRVRVEGDRLVLDYQRSGWGWWRGTNNRDRVLARITMPELSAVELSGETKLDISGFSGAELVITASGATKIDGRDGAYDELTLVVSGAGDVDLGRVVVDQARVVVSGAGNVLLNMNGGALSGTISGVGKVRYRGSVSRENVVASGMSSVEALD